MQEGFEVEQRDQWCAIIYTAFELEQRDQWCAIIYSHESSGSIKQ
jgi:hypothetical protein